MDSYFGRLPSFPSAVVLFLSRSANALDTALTTNALSAVGSQFHSAKTALVSLFFRSNSFTGNASFRASTWFLVGMGLTALCGVGSVVYLRNKQKSKERLGSTAEEKSNDNHDDASLSEPGLFKKHSTIRSYHVPATSFTYPEIRTFHVPHHQESKLPQKPCPIPLLVFVHGLGGSCLQFHAVLKSLVDIAPVLAIDLPGCGLSSMKPKSWKAYTTDSLVQLLAVAIEAHRDRDAGQGVILVGHSYGTSLSVLLASSSSPHAGLISDHTLGLIAICPALPPDEKHKKAAKLACYTPSFIFDRIREWDRRGGVNSVSVERMAGKDADEATRTLQVKFNKQSRTPVWQRMMYGAITNPSTGNFPGESVWAGLKIPLLLIGGEADTVTPVEHVKIIVTYLGLDSSAVRSSSEKMLSQPIQTDPSTESTSISPHPRSLVVKSVIFPKPAAHSLLFAPSTSRILSALISNFVEQRIDPRLSAAWQLHYLNKEGKWDVKNLEKWKAVPSVSQPVADTFRAMKTLREVDERHSPKHFVTEYAGQIAAVVDISRESPVYDPKGLEEGGIRYYKFPTVSKLPPTGKEAEEFIALLDRVKDEVREDGLQGLIGVHCHYGFNRTGFFLVCYMVERLGYSVEDAIKEFKRARGPGIKHAHFIDALHVRYYQGLKRAPTL